MDKKLSCFQVFIQESLWDDNEEIFRKNVKKWAIKNHPDKNPNADLSMVKNVFSCRESHSELKTLKPYIERILSLQQSLESLQNSVQECKRLGSMYFQRTQILENNFGQLESQLAQCKSLGSQYWKQNLDLESKLTECKLLSNNRELETKSRLHIPQRTLITQTQISNPYSRCEKQLDDFTQSDAPEVVNFERCDFDDKYADKIIAMLKKNPHIKEVRLDKNKFTDITVMTILEYMITNNNNIENLIIHENCLTQVLIDHIVDNIDRIHKHTKLLWIWLKPNLNCHTKLDITKLNSLFAKLNSRISIGHGYNVGRK